MNRKYSILAIVASFLIVAAGAAHGAPTFQPGTQAIAGCAAQEQPVLLPGVQGAEILLFAVPTERLATGERLALTVLDGERAVLRETFDLATEVAEEKVSDGEFTVFEAFAEAPQARRQLRGWAERFTDRYSIELTVDGKTLAHMSAGEFAEQSRDARRLGVLPTAVTTDVERLGGSADKFVVCGDNVCSGGTFPNGEDCETCPQDCGSCSGICGNNYCGPNEDCNSCSADCGTCPECPTDLGEEDRTELIGTVSLGWQCMQDIYYPYDSEYFDYTRFDYKTYRVHRVRECDGSITETVVPGSTSYYSTYCYRYTFVPCSYGFGQPFCVTY